MDFEYRRTELEQALLAARQVQPLESALKAVTNLTSDLALPEVYGQKLFASDLDRTVPVLARRLSLVDAPQGKSNDNVVIVATELYSRGGHSKVAADLAALIGAERVSVILTDIYNRLNQFTFLNARARPPLVNRRADILLLAPSLTGKIIELYNILCAIRPTRILMLTHHFDLVAAVALWPFRDVVEFLHHADHVPAVGATLPFSKHVDLTWTCHQACRARNLRPTYAGMTVQRAAAAAVAPPVAATRLRIATCGHVAKYQGQASYRWVDYVVAALSTLDAEIVHIGPETPELRGEIGRYLLASGVDPDRYLYMGEVPDLPAALVECGAQLYLSSYPVSGGKSNMEAMAAGLATIVPVDPASPPLVQFDLPAGSWIRVRSPDELRRVLTDPALLEPQQAATRAHMVEEEMARFERYAVGCGPSGA